MDKEQSVRDRRADLGLLLVMLLGVACAWGCARDEAVGSAETQEPRHTRRFLPFEERWRSESEIPKKPQKTPRMVIWEFSKFPPGQPPTLEEAKAAAELVEACYRAALEHGWYDFKKGLADGFELMFRDHRHYENRENIFDDRVLDPDRPEFLMYYGTPNGKMLSGFMFYTAKLEDRGPQIGGNLTIWHYHIWSEKLCYLKGLLSVGQAEKGVCAKGVPTHRSPEMMHVWLIDHPQGPFTSSMLIDPRDFAKMVEKRDRERPETRIRPAS